MYARSRSKRMETGGIMIWIYIYLFVGCVTSCTIEIFVISKIKEERKLSAYRKLINMLKLLSVVMIWPICWLMAVFCWSIAVFHIIKFISNEKSQELPCPYCGGKEFPIDKNGKATCKKCGGVFQFKVKKKN